MFDGNKFWRLSTERGGGAVRSVRLRLGGRGHLNLTDIQNGALLFCKLISNAVQRSRLPRREPSREPRGKPSRSRRRKREEATARARGRVNSRLRFQETGPSPARVLKLCLLGNQIETRGMDARSARWRGESKAGDSPRSQDSHGELRTLFSCSLVETSSFARRCLPLPSPLPPLPPLPSPLQPVSQVALFVKWPPRV